MSRVRGRWVALALAVLLLPTASADWLQPGYDAAQTGNTPEAGPAWDDVVMQLRIPVNDQPIAPLILNGSAYIAYRQPLPSQLDSIVRVPLDDPHFVEVANFTGGFIKAMASDGRSLFVLTDGGFVFAIDAATGLQSWAAQVRPFREADPGNGLREQGVVNCLFGRMVYADGHVVVACDAHQSLLYVASYGASEGRLEWDYLGKGDRPQPNGQGGIQTDKYTDMARDMTPPAGSYLFPTGLTVLGSRAIVASLVVEGSPLDGSSRGTASYGQYTAVENGQVAWVESDGVARELAARAAGNMGSANSPPAATGTADLAVLELMSVEGWRSGNTGPYADERAVIRAQGSLLEGDPGSGFAWTADGLYATSRNGLFLLDSTFTLVGSTLAPDGQEWAPGPLTRAANGVLYAGSGADGAGFGGTHGNIVALRAPSMAVQWLHRFPSDTRFAVSGGLLVAWSEDGTLTVLGHNAASPQPVAKVSSAIPSPGDLVTVDLSGSGAGLFGNVTQYRADWGDGQATEWQDAPVLRHRFSTLTNVESRFFVRNAANQTASVTQLFVVGGRPDLTFLQRQFAPEHQNTTFFVLGLLATALAALWGVVQIRRSHHRLRRELQALERRLQELQGRPESLDGALRSFRAHAHDLLVRRKLDQAQYLVLRERIDDLQRGTRMAAVDERLSFLPHGMVKRLEAMLADAHVSGWERHHFLEALEQERSLSPAQRQRARGLVESWFRADQGAGPDGR